MPAELGNFSLSLSLFLTGLLTFLPLLPHPFTYARLLGGGLFLFLLFSFLTLIASFLTDDFSLLYVATNSSSSLPWFYKLTATWGAHEGSMLLWCLLLAGWLLMLIVKLQDPQQGIRSVSLVALVLLVFLMFLFFTSNPFIKQYPPIQQGADLNPLLQDFAFIIHPPMLYMGYVGFVITCALALSGALSNQPTRQAARLIRPWANYSWAFLGLGIALGSWWAYYELGWGGWWFWDPVENSSLMPWLTGAALVHSLRVAEVHGRFHRWVIFLALLTFSLSLFGAFLVRSGILSSVHSFAEDKQRGVFLLIMWIFLSCAGWWILMRHKSSSVLQKTPFFSRAGMLLVNNILLVFAMLCILIGTLYPLIVELIGNKLVSVGAPYFISLVAPLTVMGGLAASFVVLFDWNGKRRPLSFKQSLFLLILLCFAITTPLIFGDGWHWGASVTLFIGSLLVATAFFSLQGLRSFWLPHRIGFFVGHLGFALLILGAGLNTIYHTQRQLVMGENEEAQLRGDKYVVRSLYQGEELNYKLLGAHIEVFSSTGRKRGDMYPVRRLYEVRNQLTTESAIIPGLFADLLVTLGAEESEGRYVFTLHHHPFVRWVWLGMAFISIGSLVAARKQGGRSAMRNETA